MVDHVANADAASATSRWLGSRSSSSSERAAPLLPEAPPASRAPSASLSRYILLVVVQSFAFFLTFAAFNAAQSLDGSIRAPPGLAPVQFMAIYCVFAAFAIPAPKLLSYIGPKACMALGMSPYVGLTLSFLAPPYCTGDSDDDDGTCWSVATIWALRIGTGVLLGLGAPILWTGQGVYLARLAAHEARRAPAPSDGAATEASRAEQLSQTLKRFNGIFFSAFQLSGATGLVGSSLLLTFVKSSSATTYLFIGLSILTGAGLLCIVLCLPALPPVADDADAEGAPVNSAAAPAKPKAEENVTILATLHLCGDPRMLLVVPNIVYNGLSLGFIWYLYNTFVFNTALGTSFVGFGGAAGYLANSVATQGMSRVASRFGQMPTMVLATALQLLFYAMVLAYRVKPVECLASGCAPSDEPQHGGGRPLSCFSGNDTLPVGCVADGVPCATCAPYTAEGGQECAVGWHQCQWLHGDAEQPAALDVAFMLVALIVFQAGDAVWESQVPTVLQTFFDERSGVQPAAMANLKLWQSLGIGAMFGLAQLNDLHLTALLLLVALVLSSASLLWVHTRIANLDSGKTPRASLEVVSSSRPA